MDPTLWQDPDRRPGTSPAGWYPDAYQQGFWRWFDGNSWTADVRPGGPVVRAPSPTDDLAGEGSARPWAKVGICVLAFFGPCIALVYALSIRSVVHDFSRAIDQARLHQQGAPVTPVSPIPGGLSVGLDLFCLMALGAEIALMIWMYRAAQMGKRLGMPTTLDPVWAIVGWLVPIVNFWFPYKVIVGTLPIGDPVRRNALRWWVLYIVGTVFFAVTGLVLAFLPRPALVVLAPLLLYSWYEAKQGLATVEGVDAAHTRAVRALGYGVPPR